MSTRAILCIAAISHVSGYLFAPEVFGRSRHRLLDAKSCRRNSLPVDNEPLIENLKIPLLRRDTFLPLPSSHLPDELATLNVYSINIDTAVDRSIVEYATENTDSYIGHVCIAPQVGAVGCTSRALSTLGDDDRLLVCKSSFRFVVKQVLQEIPFPIVLVDELVDQDTSGSDPVKKDATDVIKRTSRLLEVVDEYCQQQVETAGEVSPLEQAILEETGNTIIPIAIQQLAMEKAAVLQVFRASYLDSEQSDFSISQTIYAASILAAEIADFTTSQRQEVLEMTDCVARLAYVNGIIEETVGMARARKMAEQITAATDEASKDLKIGQPQLPPWAKSIRKGTAVEYFWNEEYGWCRGEVVEDPVHIVDEIVLTVRFDDGETHRLPFSADEKIRWRPPSRPGE
ncbi:hypothetical protein FisN_18Hh126 [Fistulifera solaris]|jgi:hypothetical protein|uniref:Lon N-terminal domain-containing protein n=1 Tax=Fistulifera solaris TaxID=1519565 RepID=A0A1Z5JVT9_FISSO|nr:hypothetical protein FisN_18Hh126 [Fistulifera solaris]|eukprot:GAX17918.1 hypothetical protein FisN_18Hh126 [Fistulifera solaris]